MAVIRTRTDGSGQTSYQLVEPRCDLDQEEPKVLLHLERFPSLEQALENWPREIEDARAWAAGCRRNAARHTGRRTGGHREGSSTHRQWLALAEASERRVLSLEGRLAWLKDYLGDRSFGAETTQPGRETPLLGFPGC